jgi:hypothetical protein
MARPEKEGLDYFPFDIDFFDDEKIIAISGEFGIKGEMTAIKLLCAIYRNGYFILWNDLLKYKLLKLLPGISSELIERIVNRLVLWGFFDKNLFDSVKVLTSKGIQRRYFEIVKRRKRTSDFPYLLVNVYNNPVNVDNNSVNVCKNPTKERKEKEIKNNPPIIPPGGKLDSSDSGTSRQTSGPKKEKVAPKRKNIDLSSVEPSFQPIVADWLAYKSERGQTYRQRGFDAFYSRLLDLSSHSAETARRIIEQSMSNNWAGIFALTTDNYARNSENQSPSRDSLARAVAEGISRAHTRQEWE